MKIIHQATKMTMVGAIASAFVFGSLHAATVIWYDGIGNDSEPGYTNGIRANWGGSTNPHFTLPSPTDTGDIRTWKYSDTTPISPSTGYTGPEIYAALQKKSNTGTASNLAGASGIYTGSLTYTSFLKSGFAVVSGDNGSELTAMIFFKPESIALGQTIKFDSSSSISLMGNHGVVSGTADMRFVVQNNGLWYISNAITSTVISSPGSGKQWTLTGLDSYQFALFDPVNAAPLPIASSISTFDTLGSTFEDITAVGYYFTATGPDSNYPWISLWDFTVNATVVPEPSTVLLLFGGLTLLFYSRRHRFS